jgi:hypothetical protein
MIICIANIPKCEIIMILKSASYAMPPLAFPFDFDVHSGLKSLEQWSLFHHVNASRL